MKHYVIFLRDSLHTVTIWADSLDFDDLTSSLIFLHKADVVSIFCKSDVDKVYIYNENKDIFDPDLSELVYSA